MKKTASAKFVESVDMRLDAGRRSLRWAEPTGSGCRPSTSGEDAIQGRAAELKPLEEENRKLKRIVASMALDIEAYKELQKGKW